MKSRQAASQEGHNSPRRNANGPKTVTASAAAWALGDPCRLEITENLKDCQYSRHRSEHWVHFSGSWRLLQNRRLDRDHIPTDMAYKTPEEDLVVFADNGVARMEKDGKTKLRPDCDVLLRSLLCVWQRWPRGPKESAELYPLVWNGMHVQPYPSTQTIKQEILVYAECTSDSEFKGKFAPDLVGNNSVPSLMTSPLNKANYFSKNVRGKAASAVHEMATHVYGRMADDSRDRSTTLQ
ncbi:TPA: hypothetical protein ACH3X1_014713 [Trebouxia sp. C0004]